MKLYRFELLFFDGTVITGKFCVGVPLNIQSIYLSPRSTQSWHNSREHKICMEKDWLYQSSTHSHRTKKHKRAPLK